MHYNIMKHSVVAGIQPGLPVIYVNSYLSQTLTSASQQEALTVLKDNFLGVFCTCPCVNIRVLRVKNVAFCSFGNWQRCLLFVSNDCR